MKNLQKSITEEVNFSPKKKLKKQKSNNQKENYMKWSIDQLNNEIKTLKKSMNENEESQKFTEAENNFKKIKELSTIKSKKNIDEAKNKQKKEKDNLKTEEKEKLEEFNNKMDEKWDELKYTFDGMKTKLKQIHIEELKKFNDDFEKKFSRSVLKESKELIVAKKELKVYTERKEYNFFLIFF